MPSTPLPRDRRLAIALLFILLALVMAPNLLWLAVGSDLPHPWVAPVILPSSFLLVLLAVLGGRLWGACLVLLPFAALTPLEGFYIASYQRPSSPQIIATLVASNPREMREYIGPLIVPMALCVLAALALALAAAWASRRVSLRLPARTRWAMATLALAMLLAAAATTSSGSGNRNTRLHAGSRRAAELGVIQYGWPFGLISRLLILHREWSQMHANVARLNGFRFGAHAAAAVPGRQVYVLVIGETSRRDHWSLFGYARPTTPELARTANLVPIRDFDSAWPESMTAIPMILTRKPATVTSLSWWKEASILRAMAEAGFTTYWISNQLAIDQPGSALSAITLEAQHRMFLNHTTLSAPGAFDEVLLKPLRETLHGSNENLFIVVHLMGSHQTYDYRYPIAYKRWRPTESDPAAADASVTATNQRIVNSYDNSIAYTDHILAAIIGILRDEGAISALWFESDHGESLPTATCTLQSHGHGTRHEYEIPALAWYSDSYQAAFPQRVAAVRANAGKRSMSQNTFESLADMAGITFPSHDPSWSLFSPDWVYHPRIVNRPVQVDIDNATIDERCGLAHPARQDPVQSPASR